MKKNGNQKISWPNKFIDLIVVIAGVSIAFALTNWQQNSQAEAKQHRYLTLLRNDLVKDRDVLTEDLKGLRVQIHKCNRLLALTSEKNPKTDSLNYFLSGIMSQATFSPNNFTFQAIGQSGDISGIDDVDLMRELSELYLGSYPSIREVERIALNSFEEHIVGRIVAGQGFGPNEIKEPGFAGLVSVLNGMNGQRLSRYEQAVKQINTLLDRINPRLEE
ncbi:MAG TPA: DUF6090 family protein [Cyclobacteriaceae bacterium]|nr:DUF6090 family protein [Cyclobacteriaceae bacterium]